METKNKITEKNIPYIVFESTIARMDRTIKRLWILAIILIILLVGTNIAWLYYESQFEEIENTTTEVSQELKSNKGDATINDGVHINGERKTDGQNNKDQN